MGKSVETPARSQMAASAAKFSRLVYVNNRRPIRSLPVDGRTVGPLYSAVTFAGCRCTRVVGRRGRGTDGLSALGARDMPIHWTEICPLVA